MLVTKQRTKSAARSFMEDGLAEIVVDPSVLAQHLAVVKDGMRRLSDNPEAQALFPYTVMKKDAMGWDEDAGFLPKRGDETKDYFHHCPTHVWQLDCDLARSFLHFFEACSSLTFWAYGNVLTLLQEVDREYKCNLAHYFKKQYVVTRIVRYRKLDPRIKEDALPHFDRNGITHHTWASHPGLMVYRNGSAHPVEETSWDRVAIFPGKKFLALVDGVYGDHGAHGARDMRTTTGGNDRIGIITFTHCELPPFAVDWLQKNDARLKELANSYRI